jgi:hypothetical protein
MGKLENLQVERTDAVAVPATGHRWIILKSEDRPQRPVKKKPTAKKAVAKKKTKPATIERLEKSAEGAARPSFRNHMLQPVNYDGRGDARS